MREAGGICSRCRQPRGRHGCALLANTTGWECRAPADPPPRATCDREDCAAQATSAGERCADCGRRFARCAPHGGDRLAHKFHRLHAVAAHDRRLPPDAAEKA